MPPSERIELEQAMNAALRELREASTAVLHLVTADLVVLDPECEPRRRLRAAREKCDHTLAALTAHHESRKAA